MRRVRSGEPPRGPRGAAGAASVLPVLLLLAVTAGAQAPRMQGRIASEERLVRVLALGDSYTIGEGVAPAERWPLQLVGALRAGGQVVVEPRIIARTGWTTDELAQAIAASSVAADYDLVSLLIGVNDQYRGRSISEYPERFRSLLNQAIGFAGGSPGRVLVLSIPDWGVTPFASGRDRAKIAAEIDAYNAVNRAETEGKGRPRQPASLRIPGRATCRKAISLLGGPPGRQKTGLPSRIPNPTAFPGPIRTL